MVNENKSIKYDDVLSQIPENLRSEFCKLVEDYRFAAHLRYGKRYVSYIVLSDLIKAGWRCSAKPIED